jgi:hypothetical protein
VCGITLAQQSKDNAHPAGKSLIQTVSIVQLIANPEAYEGKQVSIRGFFHFEFEENAIYLHREDFDQLISENAIWIKLRGDISKELINKLNNHYVNCGGTFSARSHGHMGAFMGELSDVSIFPAPSRAELDQMVNHK